MNGDLPQQSTINQYVADGVTTIYNYTYLILIPQDIAVYVTLSGQQANPTNDIQILNTAYTVQNVGNLTGGTITFLGGFIPPIGATVTLTRNMQVSIDTEFAQAQNFNGQNLDNAFERVLLIMQQLNTDFQLRCLSYVINSYLPTLGTNFLPILTNVDNQVWVSQGGKIIAANIETDPDISLLRGELASQTEGADGVRLIGLFDPQTNTGKTLQQFLVGLEVQTNGSDGVGSIGYYDINNNLGQTLRTFLNNLPTYINNIIAASGDFKTGDLKPSHIPNPNPVTDKFILWVNGTIGSATSGSTYSGSYMQNLFVFYWNTYPNAQCPVSGGRGANATADFNANKQLSLPLGEGCALVNCVNNYTPGSKFGNATVSLNAANNGPHSHVGSTCSTNINFNSNLGNGGLTIGGYSRTGLLSDNIPGTVSVSSDGSGTPFSIIPPSTGIYVHIKI